MVLSAVVLLEETVLGLDDPSLVSVVNEDSLVELMLPSVVVSNLGLPVVVLSVVV